jgi:hypothetical protein
MAPVMVINSEVLNERPEGPMCSFILLSEGHLFVWNLEFGIWNFQTSQVLFGSGLSGLCPSVAKKNGK